MSYLVFEDDFSISLETQRAQIVIMERESGNKVDVTSINDGYVPSVSAPDGVMD